MNRLFLFFVTVFSSCSILPGALKPASPSADTAAHTMWIVNHGWPTGVVIERAQLEEYIPTLRKHFADQYYLEIGWGDAEFYQAGTITPRLVIQALFFPTRPVLHVVGFSEYPGNYFGTSEVSRVRMTNGQYNRLLMFVNSSFSRDRNGQVYPLGTGIYGHSHFYPATGMYHALNNCNQWTAKALSSSGVEINASLSLMPDGIMNVLVKREL